MQDLTQEELGIVSAGAMNVQILLFTTLGGMIVGGATGGYFAMQLAMSSAAQIVITPLVAACCAGVGGTTGIGLGLTLQ